MVGTAGPAHTATSNMLRTAARHGVPYQAGCLAHPTVHLSHRLVGKPRHAHWGRCGGDTCLSIPPNNGYESVGWVEGHRGTHALKERPPRAMAALLSDAGECACSCRQCPTHRRTNTAAGPHVLTSLPRLVQGAEHAVQVVLALQNLGAKGAVGRWGGGDGKQLGGGGVGDRRRCHDCVVMADQQHRHRTAYHKGMGLGSVPSCPSPKGDQGKPPCTHMVGQGPASQACTVGGRGPTLRSHLVRSAIT